MAEPIINLTRGMPPVEVFPAEDLIQCGEAALRRDPNVLLQYGHSPGYTPLREWTTGRGETTILPTASAILSATHDATGVWISNLPASPECVWHALQRREVNKPTN